MVTLPGDVNGFGTNARFGGNLSVLVGAAADNSGNTYVSEVGAAWNALRAVKTGTAEVSSLAGGAGNGLVNGIGSAAQFSWPYAIAFTSNTLYVADTINNVVRAVMVPTQRVTTFAGGGLAGNESGHVDGSGTAARFYYPMGIAATSSGTIYVADTYNNLIRAITTSGDVSTLAGGNGGTTGGYVNGVGTSALFNYPMGVAIDTWGTLYVADTNNQVIRAIVVSTMAVTTLAGGGSTMGNASGYINGYGTAALFNAPTGVAVSTGKVYVFVADSLNFAIRAITPSTGGVVTLAGNGTSGNSDGTGAVARLGSVFGIAANPSVTLFVPDGVNGVLRTIQCTTASASPSPSPIVLLAFQFLIALGSNATQAQAQNALVIAAMQADVAGQLGVAPSAVNVTVAPASRRHPPSAARRRLQTTSLVYAYTATVVTTQMAASGMQTNVTTISADSPAALSVLLAGTLVALTDAGTTPQVQSVAVSVNGVACPAPCDINSILYPAANTPLNIGAIIGGVIGGVAFVAIVVGVSVWMALHGRCPCCPAPPPSEGGTEAGAAEAVSPDVVKPQVAAAATFAPVST